MCQHVRIYRDVENSAKTCSIWMGAIAGQEDGMRGRFILFATIEMAAGIFAGCSLDDIENKACELNMHHEGRLCVPDTTQKCGDALVDCTALGGWESGWCVQGACVVKQCKAGYHESGDLCAPDSVSACGSDDRACGADQICEAGECQDCAENEKVVGGVCVEKTAAFCDAAHACPVNLRCVDDVCVKCPSGQHVKGDECIEDTWQACGSEGYACGVSQICANGNCTVCGSGFHGESGICVEDSWASCSTGDTSCGANQICAEGKCAYCSTGFHGRDGVCVEDSWQACGAEDNACGDNQVCVNSRCERCPGGEHGREGECVADTWTDCGSEGNACGANQYCEAGECRSCELGTHGNSGVCEPDSVEHCGFMGNACAGGMLCMAGECANCPFGEHSDGEKCVADSVDACGVDGVNCAAIDGWGAGECRNGNCVVSQCREGYCLNGTVCVAGVTDALCGITGGACATCTGRDACQNGECVQTACDKTLCDWYGVCENDRTHCGSSCIDCMTYNHAVSGVCSSGGECSASECEAGYHRETNANNNGICVRDTNARCGGGAVNCSELGQVCYHGHCTGIQVSDKPLTVKCGSAANSFKVSLKGNPGGTVKVSLMMTDANGAVLTGKANGVSMSPSTLTFTPSNYSSPQTVRIVSPTQSFVPDQSYYKGAKIELVMSMAGVTDTLKTSFTFNYFAFCDRTFSYTGSLQSVTLPKGKYRLVVRGAGGGGSGTEPAGGTGGYAAGTLTLPSRQTAYVAVGGGGKACSSGSCGGYNGGSPGNDGAIARGYGGGGATDIRIGASTYAYRVITAGGGGGGYWYVNAWTFSNVILKGGNGGGAIGQAGAVRSSGDALAYGGGSGGCSSTSLGVCKFGSASASTITDTGKHIGGGGGGWFSGASGQAQDSSGGGGSGYVFTGVTSAYTKAGGKLSNTFKLSNTSLIAGNGSGTGLNGSASITVLAE